MKFPTLAATALLLPLVSAGCSAGPGTGVSPQTALAADTRPKKTLRAFKSEQELQAYLRKLVEERKRKQPSVMYGDGAAAGVSDAMSVSPMVTKSEVASEKLESITNTQHAGVDEGGIVKLHGDHLVVLRRGRLFTIATG